MYYYLGNIQGTILHSNIRTKSKTKTMENTTIPNVIGDTTTFEDFSTTTETVETTITPGHMQDDEFYHLGHYLGYGVLAGIATLVAIIVIIRTLRNLRRKTEYNRLI